jgi:hypothetical protein
MGKQSRNVWLLRVEDFEDIIDDMLQQVPELMPRPHPEYTKGITAGLRLSVECAKRRSYEALEIDLEKDQAQA